MFRRLHRRTNRCRSKARAVYRRVCVCVCTRSSRPKTGPTTARDRSCPKMSRRPHRVGNSRNSRRTTPPHPYTLGNERVLIRPVDGTTRSRHTYGDAYVCRYRVLDSNRARVFVTNVHEIVISRCRSRRPNYKYSLEIQPVAQTDGLVTQFREYCKLYMCVYRCAGARTRDYVRNEIRVAQTHEYDGDASDFYFLPPVRA